MKYLQKLFQEAMDFFARYPAVLSGYIIYGYLFLAIMRLYYRAKHGEASISDAYDIFSALPFMWFLAVALVKIMNDRTKLHESQTQILGDREELRVKETQLTTMKEVVRGLQHHVNNPLAIISLVLPRIKRRVEQNAAVLEDVNQIERASERISAALAGFSSSAQYEVTYVERTVGTIAVPRKS